MRLLVFEFGLYVWHWSLHNFNFLWRGLHQIHHSAERLDTYGAFWFSPLGLFCPWSARPVREITEIISHISDPAQPLSFEVFPNPSTGVCRLKLPEATSSILVIRDYHGRVIHRQSFEAGELSLDLHHLTAGLYTISIMSGQRRGTKKLVLLH